MFTENISLLAALGAGFISFISPCVLPLIPGYLSFISGVSVADLGGAAKRGGALRDAAVSPFLVTAISFNFFPGFSSFFKKHFRAIEVASGLLLVAIGLLMFFNQFGL